MYLRISYVHPNVSCTSNDFGHPSNIQMGLDVPSNQLDIQMGIKSFGTFHSPCEEYRIAGYFRGVPNFVIFVVNLEVTKFSTNEYSVTHACAATRAYKSCIRG